MCSDVSGVEHIQWTGPVSVSAEAQVEDAHHEAFKLVKHLERDYSKEVY